MKKGTEPTTAAPAKASATRTRTLAVNPDAGGKNWVRFGDKTTGILVAKVDVPDGTTQVVETLRFS